MARPWQRKAPFPLLIGRVHNENSRATSSLFSSFKSSYVNKVTHTKECDFLTVAKEGNYDLHKTDNFKIDIRDFNFHKTLNIDNPFTKVVKANTKNVSIAENKAQSTLDTLIAKPSAGGEEEEMEQDDGNKEMPTRNLCENKTGGEEEVKEVTIQTKSDSETID